MHVSCASLLTVEVAYHHFLWSSFHYFLPSQEHNYIFIYTYFSIKLILTFLVLWLFVFILHNTFHQHGFLNKLPKCSSYLTSHLFIFFFWCYYLHVFFSFSRLTRIVRWDIFVFAKASCTFLCPYFCLYFVWLFHRLFKWIFSSSTYVLMSNLFFLLHFIEMHVCCGAVRMHFHFIFFCYNFFKTQFSCNILMCTCDVQFFSHTIRHDVLCNMSFLVF